MAVMTTRVRSRLSSGFVLAPERYDPRRELNVAGGSFRLGELVSVVNETVPPGTNLSPSVVWDTGDAKEGIVVGRKPVTTVVGSTKKILRPGDIVISRLRPYLRQVAFVDAGVPHVCEARLLCSTEFFVLRARDEKSIAFLAAYLLSGPVQLVLAASQEGGHHPRFDLETLLTLPVPNSLVETRDEVSRGVESAIRRYRESEAGMSGLVESAEMLLSSQDAR